MKTPKSLAECADLMYQVREKRLTAQKVVDALAADETQLREHIIQNLPKSNATGISGKLATARIELKRGVQVEDWSKLYAYVKKTSGVGGFALLQRRVGEAAVKEIWDSGKAVPGVTAIQVPVVSLTKR
jgi:hypothetical protein